MPLLTFGHTSNTPHKKRTYLHDEFIAWLMASLKRSLLD